MQGWTHVVRLLLCFCLCIQVVNTMILVTLKQHVSQLLTRFGQWLVIGHNYLLYKKAIKTDDVKNHAA